MNIIKNIVSRDCNVGESNRTVIKHVISKLKDGYNTFSNLPKNDRRILMSECIKWHSENGSLYDFVMR